MLLLADAEQRLLLFTKVADLHLFTWSQKQIYCRGHLAQERLGFVMGQACFRTRSPYLALVRVFVAALYHQEMKEQSFRFCLKRDSGIFLGLNVLCVCVYSFDSPPAWTCGQSSGWRRKRLWLVLQLDALSVEQVLAGLRGPWGSSASGRCLSLSCMWSQSLGHLVFVVGFLCVRTCTCERSTSSVLKLNLVWTGVCFLKRSNFQYIELGINTEAVEFIEFF